jgi:hypothetical protein
VSHGGTCDTCGAPAVCSEQDPTHKNRWTIQHSMKCRLAGDLFNCPINKAAQHASGLGILDDVRGRFVATVNEHGRLVLEDM